VSEQANERGSERVREGEMGGGWEEKRQQEEQTSEKREE